MTIRLISVARGTLTVELRINWVPCDINYDSGISTISQFIPESIYSYQKLLHIVQRNIIIIHKRPNRHKCNGTKKQGPPLHQIAIVHAF